MIVVDTSVWVDLFRDDMSPQALLLVELLERDADVAVTDVVLSELLQGVNDSEARKLDTRLGVLGLLRLETLDDFRRSAALYRSARLAGHTIRRTIDCFIASVCVREDVPILHNDADFDRLASCTELQVVRAAE